MRLEVPFLLPVRLPRLGVALRLLLLRARLPPRQLRTLPLGASELLGLGKGISEDKETNYNNEERKLLEVNQNIKNLIQELEQKDNAKTQ